MTATLFRVARALIPVGLFLPGALSGHSSPDIPVQTSFGDSDHALITINLDMRCLESDPENAPYIHYSELESFTEAERTEIVQRAASLIDALVDFEFKPGGRVDPEFTIEFVPRADVDPVQTEDILFLRARASLRVPQGAEAYRIHALDRGDLTVYFLNELYGVEANRFQALFPGETSYWLALARPGASSGQPDESATGGPRPVVASAKPTRWAWIIGAVALVTVVGGAIAFLSRASARS
mgnify:CR=1 FL=1